jgi:hypothetical protein
VVDLDSELPPASRIFRNDDLKKIKNKKSETFSRL